jgi:hypothetical protein
MSIEILDKGACKAAGKVDVGTPVAFARTQGIVSVTPFAAGHIRLALSEGIGQEEFIGLATNDGEGTGIIPQVVWIDAFTVDIFTKAAVTGDPAEGVVYFIFFRIEGGQPTIVPPVA